MMQETRVNLKHLLEDIRDSYGFPVEEAILSELIANSLDSKASKIEFFTNPLAGKLMVRDNGQGMKRKEIHDYHDIAATTKIKGKGIGFAGIGAKLALLISKSVITETKRGSSRCATYWYLARENRAPWKFIPFQGNILSSRGTAITIEFSNSRTPLLSEDFISKTIQKHFYPLLDPQFLKTVYRSIYKRGVEFFVNGRKIGIENLFPVQFSKTFKIFFGKKERRLVGFGYLSKSETEFPQEFSGIAISTFGKVIKRGWDWLGILPRSPFKIFGIIEIPLLAEILTTNKNDFLRDASSLKKYYRCRKAIQEVILPILDEMGEERFNFESDLKRLKPLEREIEETLRYLLNNFPELTPLVGLRKRRIASGIDFENEESSIKIIPREELKKEIEKRRLKTELVKTETEEREKAPTLAISFEKNSSKAELARFFKNTILINTNHPAYQKAKSENSEEYHLLLAVAWVLSQYLEENRSPQDFISQFLAFWAAKDKPLQLFEA